MKFSELWLREWINPPVDTNGLAEQLTFLGLEVDDVESAAPGFENVVAARIESVEKHPDADRLRVCGVNDGSGEQLQVVCGAPNARAGLITALARVGGKLPDGTRMKKAKLRGVESSGMLCSAAELGLGDDTGGIWELPETLEVGTDLIKWLELEDSVIDIDLTPDRGDCLSIRGIARDLSARNDLPLALHEITPSVQQIEDRWPVNVDTQSACVRYAGRIIRNLNLQSSSPEWMVERLRRSGIRSINAAVDVTNYVMLELGQPMHAFDLDKLHGAIQVRLARQDEPLVLLDGREVKLDAQTTVIADDNGAIGIGGIMGGQGTGVTKDTTNIFFESALFLPQLIAGKPRQYASHTDSAHRFERGVDPDGQVQALEYATGLLRNITGGKAGPVDDWQDENRLPKRSQVKVRATRLQRLLGIAPESTTVQTVFTRLGLDSEISDDGWLVTAPGYRYDLEIEEDFIEEVARVLGYDSIPRTFPQHTPLFTPQPESRLSVKEIKQLLVARGYQEVVTYSFVDAEQQRLLRPELESLALANPISSEMGVMRTNLVGGLLGCYQHNASRQTDTMRLFETGLRFLGNSSSQSPESLDRYILATHGNDIQSEQTLQQQHMLAGLVTGRQQAENWNTDAAVVDFFNVKADLEQLLTRANAGNVKFCSCDLDMLHPGQRASIRIDNVPVGYIGALSPATARQLSIENPVYVFECAIDALLNATVPQIETLSRYPLVRRDIALLVDESVSYEQLKNTICAAAPEIVRELRLFDIYRGEKVKKGKKSMALGLILQHFSRTLEDSDVERAVDQVVTAANTAHGAELRE